MVHLAKPGKDTGKFSTSEVRSREKPCHSTSRAIELPKGHYKQPPNLAAGFNHLDISCDAHVRANLVADDITTDAFRISVETWDDSKLYEAGATWIEHKANARDCVFGQFDTEDHAPHARLAGARSRSLSPKKDGDLSPPQQRAKLMTFPKPFREPPEVICWINRLDLSSGDDFDYKVHAFADNVTTKGFRAQLETWDLGQLNGAAMCWIAFPTSKRFVDSGTFRTSDVRRTTNPRPRTAGLGRFEKHFQRPPTVLTALCSFDAAGNADLRVKVIVEDVSREGFRWALETWGDSTLYGASASWIALGS